MIAQLPVFDVAKLGPWSPSGRYELGKESRVFLLRNALPLSASEVEEFRLKMEAAPATPNPMNTKTFLKRKQMTFGSKYNFGQQCPAEVIPPDQWPTLPKACLKFAKQIADELNPGDAELYNVAHCNFYRDGSVALAPHSDAEGAMVQGKPIISFSYLTGDKLARAFAIYDLDGAFITSIDLNDGDVMVMAGAMQSHYKHGVPAGKPPKKYKNSGRINVTIRCFREVTDEGNQEGPSGAKRQKVN